ncbi:MAG TPA: hypothetical protein VF363_06460 [Candidatus Eisenbacteria bacterium]
MSDPLPGPSIAVVRRVAALLVAFFVLSPGRGDADFILPPWQCIVADAQFIGIAECVVAGGIVADYRVTESWKGPPVGSRLRIAQSTSTDYGTRLYPLALVGKRYLIVANAPNMNWNEGEWPSILHGVASTTAWRRIPVDYFAPWGVTPVARAEAPPDRGVPGVLGIVPLDTDDRRTSRLDAFHEAVKPLVAMDARRLEIETLRAAAQWEAAGKRTAMTLSEQLFRTSPLCRATAPDSLEQVVAGLVAYAGRGEGQGRQALSVFLTGGGLESLRQLEALQAAKIHVDRHRYDDFVVRILRIRVGRDSVRAEVPAYMKGPPTPSALTRWRARLAADSTGHPEHGLEESEAFVALTKFEPERVAQYLVRWHPRDVEREGDGLGLTLGGYFAAFCGRDRARLLSSLLRAEDPYIRVSAAVYLCFEDEVAGQAALRDLMPLPGDPGVWAALTLARRGVKDALPRSLEVLRGAVPPTLSAPPHEYLQKRVIELLSNSAHASGISLPMDWDPEYASEPEDVAAVYDAYVRWWASEGARIRLADPWMPILAARKMD